MAEDSLGETEALAEADADPEADSETDADGVGEGDEVGAVGVGTGGLSQTQPGSPGDTVRTGLDPPELCPPGPCPPGFCPPGAGAPVAGGTIPVAGTPVGPAAGAVGEALAAPVVVPAPVLPARFAGRLAGPPPKPEFDVAAGAGGKVSAAAGVSAISGPSPLTTPR
ncbi:hypothetical protein ACWKSP_19115 [Micromonosporaceae bacterium Da 78-11]